MTGSSVKYPSRAEKEIFAKVVKNHEGGARVGLATLLRSDDGNVDAGCGLLGSRYGGGAIFGNSK